MAKLHKLATAAIVLAIALPGIATASTVGDAYELSAQKKKKAKRSAAPAATRQAPATPTTGQSGLATGGEFSFGSAGQPATRR